MFAEHYSGDLLRLSTSCICYSKSQATMTAEDWQRQLQAVGARPMMPLPMIDQYVCWYRLNAKEVPLGVEEND